MEEAGKKKERGAKATLDLLTLNCWHGLDHTNPYLMLPAENPLAAFRRRRAQLLAFREFFDAPLTEGLLTVACLQELNPIQGRVEELRRKLGIEGFARAVNVGIKAGLVSYPFFLHEGLGTLWKGPLKHAKFAGVDISGSVHQFDFLRRLAVTIQLSERRAATALTGEFGGKRLCIVNLHLHAGPPETETTRRMTEIRALLAWLSEIEQETSPDLVILAGDFNAEEGQDEIHFLETGGYTSLASEKTWDPVKNLLCARVAQLGDDLTVRKWDEVQRTFDHVLYRNCGRGTVQAKASLAMNEPVNGTWLSDHYGIRATFTWPLKAATPKRPRAAKA